MPKFKVQVAVSYLKDLTVYASDEDEASEKAVEICEKWNNVHEAEVKEVEQE